MCVPVRTDGQQQGFVLNPSTPIEIGDVGQHCVHAQARHPRGRGGCGESYVWTNNTQQPTRGLCPLEPPCCAIVTREACNTIRASHYEHNTRHSWVLVHCSNVPIYVEVWFGPIVLEHGIFTKILDQSFSETIFSGIFSEKRESPSRTLFSGNAKWIFLIFQNMMVLTLG